MSTIIFCKISSLPRTLQHNQSTFYKPKITITMTKTKTSLIMLAFAIIASTLFICRVIIGRYGRNTTTTDTKTDLLNQYHIKKEAHQSALKSTLASLGLPNSRSDDGSVIEYVFSLTDEEVDSLNQISIIECDKYENEFLDIIENIDPDAYVTISDELYQSYIEFVDIDRGSLSIPELEIVNYIETLSTEDQEVMLEILVAYNDYIDTMGEEALLSLFDRFPEAERACFEQVQVKIQNLIYDEVISYFTFKFILKTNTTIKAVLDLKTAWDLLRIATDMHICLNKAKK